MPKKICQVLMDDGKICGREVIAKGFCSLHYSRNKVGRVDTWTKRSHHEFTPEERFWQKVNKNGPVSLDRPDLGKCWLWAGSLSNDGYGNVAWGKFFNAKAHQLSYQYLIGPLDYYKFELDHLCRVRSCVNPSHLEEVTHEENIRRMSEYVWTHPCKHGHPADAHYLNKYGAIQCRGCIRSQNRVGYARKVQKSGKTYEPRQKWQNNEYDDIDAEVIDDE